MGFATAKGRLKPMNSRHGIIASETPKDLCQYHAEPLRGIGRLAEELPGIRIERVDWRRTASVTIRDLTQAGRKDFWIKGAGMQIGSGLAGLKNRAHGSVVTIMLFLFPTQALFVFDPPIGREQNYLESLLPESTQLIQRLQARTDGHTLFFPSEVLLPEADAWLDG
jgi:hypothetical protein